MQVRDLAPGAAETLVRVLERRDKALPGGVGPMTIAMLLENCLQAATRISNLT